jgi:hypothetical protein
MKKSILTPDKLTQFTKAEELNDPELLAEQFLHNEDGLVETKNPPHYPRASSIYDACMRRLVLYNQEKVVFKFRKGANLNMIFEIGNAVHSWIQNTQTIIGNNRYGQWYCPVCDRISNFKRVPAKCSHCHNPAMQYHEFEIKVNGPLYFLGHPDMFVQHPNKSIHIMEFKTISSKDFKTLNDPLLEHKWQVHGYMWGLEQKLEHKLGGQIDTSYSYIMYISKDAVGMKTFPVKVFIIKRDTAIINRIKARLIAFKNGMTKGGPLPSIHPTCASTNWTGAMARDCLVLALCKAASNV